jgi:ABC-type multidrug transport system fused ATPase/permease subunit
MSSNRADGNAHSRRGIPARFLLRAALIARWLRRLVLPRYWAPLLAAMVLRTGGALAEIASFAVAVQLLMHWATIEQQVEIAKGHPLLVAGAMLFVLMALGSVSTYCGERISVRTAVRFETYAFAHAVSFVSKLSEDGSDIDKAAKKDLFFAAPRFMSRTVLQLVGIGSSIVLMAVAAVVCFWLLPTLAGVIALIVLVTSPAYVYHALHSTQIGHRLRDATSEFSLAKKELSARWLDDVSMSVDQRFDDANSSGEYSRFLDVYSQRLVISSLSRLIVNFSLMICIVVTMLWIGANYDLTADNITVMVIFLLFLRMFFSGATAIVSAVQATAVFAPNFLLYLQLDPRMGK